MTLLFCPSSRADEVPFFTSLREELTNQLTIVSNTVPLDKKLATSLRSNLKTVDKTKPTLTAGSTALGTVAKSLGRTSLSNVFLPLITDTRSVYVETLESELAVLDERLEATIPGKQRSAAQTKLAKVSASLDGVITNADLTLSLKSLSKAAKDLLVAQKAVAIAEIARPGPDFVSATITESGQINSAFKPVKSVGLDAYYNEFSGEIEIEAGEMKSLGGGRVQVRFLELTAAVPGEGTHTLSLTNESYAIYQRGIVPNINAPEPELEVQETYFTIDPFNQTLGTGTMTITVDLEANVVWGSFTFTANGSENQELQAEVTGTFLLRLESFDDEFE